ncbi:MAG TPA: alpha/beta hydrolase-fold protein, partial [Chitinophagaceae bacterium]|nr:alpha/beta hydrolase-fold protein [Chitinophagaceae bacterium]
LLLCSFIYSFLFAQYTLRVIVDSASTRKLEDIYVAGNFNNWNPHDYNYKMKPFGGTRRVFVFKNISAGKYEFKFTRGAWEKVETTATGEDVTDHTIDISTDTSLNFTIAGWHDDYPDKPKPNTATAQVQVLDTAFLIPQLNRYRRIWIYLPKTYNYTKGKYYPVLYMHDGQNLFNEQTAPFGEWGIDECLDTLQTQLNKESIVVGIDNGGEHRMTEYNPYDNEKYGKGEGSQYVDFIAQTLKPFIDKRFRTSKDAPNTFIAGSSMGGLISLYAVEKYPDVFGAAGIFSPSFWLTPQFYSDVQKMTWKGLHRFFFYAGAKESESMISDMKEMEGVLYKSNKNIQTREVIFPLGQHNESYWRKTFPDFYKWLMQP